MLKEVRSDVDKYQTLFNNVNDAIFLTQFSKSRKPIKFLEVNDVACKRLGYSRNKLLNLSFLDITDQTRSEIAPILDKLFQTGSNTFETNHITSKGKKIPIEVSTHAFLYKDNPVALSIARDITDKKKLEEKRKVFLKIISHEIKSPLSAISLAMDLINKKNSPISEDEKHRCSEIIYHNISKINLLIKAITDFREIDAKIFSLDQKEINLSNFLEKEIKQFKIFLDNQLDYNFDSINEVSILLDANKMGQVITNILNNAINHTNPKKRKIRIFADTVSTDRVKILFSDNGVGIHSENLERIFEEFVSIPSQYSKEGTGIGLFVCRTIVSKHQGTLFAESDGLDKGTTIILELPINEAS